MRFHSSYFTLLVSMFFAIAAVGCSATLSVDGTGAADPREALLEVDRAFYQATADRGVEGFASFLAEDVWFLPGGAPLMQGREAAAKSWEPLLTDPDFSIRWEPLAADVGASADLGYTVGQYEVHGKTPEGKPFVERGKYVTVWKKQSDGSWKVVLDGGNPNGPPEVGE